MQTTGRCMRCGQFLEVLRHPIRRLRWTRYWWKGFASFFTGQLRICPQCGAMYTGDGEFLAAGAVETDAERRLNNYRNDMAYLRDGFAAVIVAAELTVIWLTMGAEAFEVAQVILAGSVGVGSFLPFWFFARKAQLAKRDLKRLKQARLRGELPPPDRGTS